MKKFLTIYFLLFTAFATYSQTEATTKDGKKVLLNDNKTWSYAEETKVENNISFECTEVISTTTDKMTGKSMTSSKGKINILDDGGKTGFGIILAIVSDALVLSIQVVGEGSCIEEGSKMNVLFRDGTRLELLNDSKFNCDGNFTKYFISSLGRTEGLEMFKTKEIETMRVWTSKSYLERDFGSNQSKKIKQTFGCLLNHLENKP